MKIIFVSLFFIKINKSSAQEKLTLNFEQITVNLQGNFIQGGLVKGKTIS